MSTTFRPVSGPWIRTAEEFSAFAPVAGMLSPWPDQYWATSEPTVPLKLLAVKAGAFESTLASTVRVSALPEAPMLLAVAAGVPVLLAEEPEPLELLPAVAEGVPEPLPELLGVMVVEPDVMAPDELLPEPANENTCQGTRTWPPEPLVPELAAGV